MIVVLKLNPNPEQLQSLITWLQEKGIIIHTSIGEGNMLLGLVGDTSKIDADLISALDIVEDVKRVQEPYKNANRKFHPEDTVVKVGNTQVGGGNLTLMAGPCSVESEEQVVAIAKAVKASGATMLRGGALLGGTVLNMSVRDTPLEGEADGRIRLLVMLGALVLIIGTAVLFGMGASAKSAIIDIAANTSPLIVPLVLTIAFSIAAAATAFLGKGAKRTGWLTCGTIVALVAIFLARGIFYGVQIGIGL